MEKNEKACEILEELDVLENIITIYLEHCKNKFNEYHSKLSEAVEYMKVDCFYKPLFDSVNTQTASAKRYADAYKTGQDVSCTLQLVRSGYNEIIFTRSLNEETNAWSSANSRGEILLGLLHESEEYPSMMKMFIDEVLFKNVKDSFDGETVNALELLKDFGALKDKAKLSLYAYCIEYMRNNPELIASYTQPVDGVGSGFKK